MHVNIEIFPFDTQCLKEGELLLRENLREARSCFPELPEMDPPPLDGFAENGLGIAAAMEGKLIGFLCVNAPWDCPWGIPGIRAVFSPIHGHAAVEEGRGEIYDRLYQAAAARWVEAGAVSHGISLYAHDVAGQRAFIWNGFGMRCVDAICQMKPSLREPQGDFRELSPEEWPALTELEQGLQAHLQASPCFLRSPLPSVLEQGARLFAAPDRDGYNAYLKVTPGPAETFLSGAPGMLNVTGAYCKPEHRGTGLMENLLLWTERRLLAEGYTRLGVDYESINPLGRCFWQKHFTPYTHGFVRRIDETALIP